MSCYEITIIILTSAIVLAAVAQACFARYVKKTIISQEGIAKRQLLLEELKYKTDMLYKNVGLMEKQRDMPDDELKVETIEGIRKHSEQLAAQIEELEKKREDSEIILEGVVEAGCERMEYRRKKGADTWHWCKNCTTWPTGTDVEIRRSKPTSGELCNQCKVKERSGTCRK